jgi:hypothetical protein
METHERALLEVMAEHLRVTEALLENHILIAQTSTGGAVDPKLVDMLPTTRAQLKRVQELLNR